MHSTLFTLLVAISAAAAVHGPDDDPLDWMRDTIPGEPGVDYPIFAEIQGRRFFAVTPLKNRSKVTQNFVPSSRVLEGNRVRTRSGDAILQSTRVYVEMKLPLPLTNPAFG